MEKNSENKIKNDNKQSNNALEHHNNIIIKERDIKNDYDGVNSENITSTPYDDVFRTMLNDCSRFILPLLNEVFGENYDGTETIVFANDYHYNAIKEVLRLLLHKAINVGGLSCIRRGEAPSDMLR